MLLENTTKKKKKEQSTRTKSRTEWLRYIDDAESLIFITPRIRNVQHFPEDKGFSANEVFSPGNKQKALQLRVK